MKSQKKWAKHISHQKWRAARTAKLGQAQQAINTHINDLAEEMRQGKSENLKRFLQYAAQFHQYSFGNIMLAAAQRKNLKRIAGIQQWNQQGRRVRRGEKGIMILAPIKQRIQKDDAPQNDAPKKESGAELETAPVAGFRPVYVFDITQTEGQEAPSIITASGNAEKLFPALLRAVRKARIEVELQEFVPGSPGAEAASFNGRIVLRKNLGAADAFRALAHEYAHEVLHWDTAKQSRAIQETEADAAAYVVCRRFGIRCDSADYLLLHESTPHILLQRLEGIRKASHAAIEAITKELEEAK